MTLKIDDAVLKVLRETLKEKNKPAFRLFVKKYTWKGPILGIVPDELKENDKEFSIKDVTFVVEPDIEYVFNNATIEYKKTAFVSKFEIIAEKIDL